MNRLFRFEPVVLLCMLSLALPVSRVAAQTDPALLSAASGSVSPSSVALRFNALNSLIRDGNIAREAARNELQRLLPQMRAEYYRRGGVGYGKDAWVFPLADHDARAIGNGRDRGYAAAGYDYFLGNRHGGHPSFDIFIHDRNRDCRDDRNGKPVRVLSLTGGIVVALEQEWRQGSRLRGGVYLWVYDPVNDLLVYYAHNSELSVGLGEIVRPGDQLAIVGRSGYNAAKMRSPTHLHLTVLKLKDGRPLPVDVYRELARATTGRNSGTE
ncbi:M23 family metallopeptidase [Pelobacter propionicus]|uniref:Peptidase M23B n=1 Tax=Pelobacter propionicus (strain DSM 2379 / NBRC 103807 / OttBd1) TaxID=338966 RepID=A1AN75_PELPD|nr:M23 family metallopeptidase [Pelobacter propionicus]ABK98795.1 peptidase M23B [Pelobacter propionicus DSM 2379]